MSSSEASSSHRRGGARVPAKSPIKSQKLDRTLLELEKAFHDWENLSSSLMRAAALEEDRQQAALAERTEETKKLLNQLRRQLAEL